ncbi:hypothetical protein Bbelb_158760 [Branchiostoma belcheri]|nr:hypothetical protein Bbelb_158760 [Branchiostoma belcheri]
MRKFCCSTKVKKVCEAPGNDGMHDCHLEHIGKCSGRTVGGQLGQSSPGRGSYNFPGDCYYRAGVGSVGTTVFSALRNHHSRKPDLYTVKSSTAYYRPIWSCNTGEQGVSSRREKRNTTISFAMKHLAVLLCLSGLAAVCLGQTNTTDVTTDATTADATTVSPYQPPTSGSGTAASPGGTAVGGVVTTDAGTGAGATTATTVSCLNCTGDDTSACGTGTGITTKVNCDACWVYRDENASGNVTITRGCAQGSDTCTTQTQSEYCTTAGGITTCRQCCTTTDCNGSSLTLTGNSGAADVTASVVVTMATALFAILALWQ